MKINLEGLDPPKRDVLKNAILGDLNYRNVIFFIKIIDIHHTHNFFVYSLSVSDTPVISGYSFMQSIV
jgi:hypothetical protein